MKIALVILHADPARGGAERYTVDLAAALARRGHDVRVLASTFAEEVPAAVRVALDASAPTRVGRYKRFIHRVQEQLAVDEYDIATDEYDIVHAMLPVWWCDVYHPHAGMAVAAARKWNSLFNPRRLAMAKVERKLITDGKPPVVIALSEYVKKSIRANYPALAEDRLATLFNAVDLARFEPADDRLRRDYVNALFIGQDFERKGLPAALEAVSMLKDDRLKLTVVGKNDGKLKPPADAAARVSFAGEVADPRPFYRDADFFVLPTRHDPCSLVVLEALAMGLPVISTKFNGACEIMTDGVHGYVLDDPNDVDALANAMRKMLDPHRRAEMSAACLALRSKLSYEHHLDQLEAIYRGVQSRKS
jgi:UDP-glucose:(heptosyl)LPS alpha-1,3-glucosyltransferase